MSECVVRMEKPERCVACGVRMACPVYRAFLQVCATGAEHPTAGQNGCIIICSLPEGHGRLVDADAYRAEMKDRQDAAWKWRNEAIAEEDDVKLARAEGSFTAFVEAKLTWDKQATIVPADTAERSEKEQV